MQKIFYKWIIIVMSIATVVLLAINVYTEGELLENARYKNFISILDQLESIVESNRSELIEIEANLDEEYMIRCKAALFYLERQSEDHFAVNWLQEFAQTIDVDEIHIINTAGIIEASSVKKYVNFDMYSGEQSASFMKLAEGKKAGESFAQDMMPNASEGIIVKYIGAMCLDGKIVQVGFRPVREMEAKKKNSYEYIFSHFPIAKGSEYFAIDIEEDKVIGHSNSDLSNCTAEDHSYEKMSQCAEGKFVRMQNGNIKYIVTRTYGNVLLGVAESGEELLYEILMSALQTMLELICVTMIISIVLNWLVKKIVVNGVHEILDDMSEITSGNLNTSVQVSGNPEFDELSKGINMMVSCLQYENNHDHLTGLCNYKCFTNMASAKLAQLKDGELFAVMMLDLDSFKQINDNYGHDIGDRYLRKFAVALSRMPEEHCYVARRSGDEFSMCLFGCSTRSDISRLVHLLETFVREEPIRLSDTIETTIKFSGGYVVTDHISEPLEKLMTKADEALYRRKKGQKGGIDEYVQC